eukprot:gb/GECG01013936.1/.p1 GENE.gb/GECG01013936.1/~~gb/GECG01013936.1/.p1  ORF type:complete len:1084 (+),score=109.20 gb/GECG01013936.1/:1-3252(+)
MSIHTDGDPNGSQYHSSQSRQSLVLGKYPVVDITDRSQLPKRKEESTNDGNLCCYRVFLSSCQLSDENSGKLARLQFCKLLVILDLSHNTISDTTCQMIVSAMKHGRLKLKDMNLSHNSITDVGAGEIADLLGLENGLRTLDLSHNRIANDGARMISRALPLCTTLREVNLADNTITNFQDLVLTASNTISSERGKDLTIRLCGNSCVAEFDPMKLTANTSVQTQKRQLVLHVSRCKLGPRELKWLAETVNSGAVELKMLNVNNNVLSKEDCAELLGGLIEAPSSAIEQLSLRSCSLYDDAIAAIVSAASALDGIRMELNDNAFSPLGCLLLESLNWQPTFVVEVTGSNVNQLFGVQSIDENFQPVAYTKSDERQSSGWCSLPVVLHGREEWIQWRLSAKENSFAPRDHFFVSASDTFDCRGVENVVKGFACIIREFPQCSVPSLLLSLCIFVNFIDDTVNDTQQRHLLNYIIGACCRDNSFTQARSCLTECLQRLTDRICTALANCVFEPTVSQYMLPNSDYFGNECARFLVNREFLNLGSIVDNTSQREPFSELVKPFRSVLGEVVNHISGSFVEDPFKGRLPTSEEVRAFCIAVTRGRKESTSERQLPSANVSRRAESESGDAEGAASSPKGTLKQSAEVQHSDETKEYKATKEAVESVSTGKDSGSSSTSQANEGSPPTCSWQPYRDFPQIRDSTDQPESGSGSPSKTTAPMNTGPKDIVEVEQMEASEPPEHSHPAESSTNSRSEETKSLPVLWPEKDSSDEIQFEKHSVPSPIPRKRDILHTDPSRWSTVRDNVKRNYKFCDKFTGTGMSHHTQPDVSWSPTLTTPYAAQTVQFSSRVEVCEKQTRIPEYSDAFLQISPVTPLSSAASSASDNASDLEGSGQLSGRRNSSASDSSKESAGSLNDSGQLGNASIEKRRMQPMVEIQPSSPVNATRRRSPRFSQRTSDRQLTAWRRQGFVRLPSGTLTAKIDNAWKKATLTIFPQRVIIDVGRILRSRSYSLRLSRCRVRKQEPGDALLLECDGRLLEDVRLKLQSPEMQPIAFNIDPIKYIKEHPAKDVPLTCPITAYYLNTLFEEFL